MKDFKKGLKSGVPIGLGYLSVSFAFGIMAISMGFSWWQAVLISMTNLTSAGQLAGIEIMVNPGLYLNMFLSQLTINVRYSFMSVSLSQKVSPQFSGIKRWILGFFMTDEIFAVASNEKEVSVKFFSGLTVFPYIGWTTGTLLGSLLGNILPDIVMNSLCLAIYGMFVAIVAPKAKENLSLLLVVGIAIALSCAFYYLPFLSNVGSGLSVCICAIIAAVIGAIFFPKEENADE
ncbi:MAG: AzlC family ABC transporter permease [Ruminococcaceae bacterium]|nr:AzlC family ABC transporter permease [Oscillospiraceae bacterium]